MKYEDIPKPIRDRMCMDELIFGNSYVLEQNGKYKRIDPMKVILNPKTQEYKIDKNYLDKL